MNVFKHRISIATALLLGIAGIGVANATIVMNFDQLNPQGEYVDNYYNGGCGGSLNGGSTTCNGPTDGVVWWQAIAGGSPNGYWAGISNEPSPPNTAGAPDQGGDFGLNVATGFTTSLSFYYTAPSSGGEGGNATTVGSVSIWSGQNGTGTLLGTLSLPATGSSCDSAYYFSCWTSLGTTFAGTAQSVVFGGSTENYQLDSVTLGSGSPINPVPEPAELGMFGLGVLLIGLFAGLRRRNAA